ncbi:MAG: hypothetical protein ACXAE3_00665 [Candidatus Kariarchaeaceae archaeon]
MSTNYQKYTSTPIGRTVLITGLLSVLFAYLAFLLPLAPADNSGLFSGLYKDVSLPDEDRFNLALVILESLFLSLTFFFLTVALAAQAQVSNQIPSWRELIVSGIIVLIMSWLVPQISVGEATLAGGSGSGFNHFTPDMQTWTFVGTVIGLILFSLYLIYSTPSASEE